MTPENCTQVTEFILLGLPHSKEMTIPLFVLFFVFYIATLAGNIILTLTICGDSRLHTPMYFFILNLALLDACFSSVTMPKLLVNILALNKTISFYGCIAQLYCYHFLGSSGSFLYPIMAFDRYVAICRPLHYATIMSHRNCVVLALGTWMAGTIHSTIYTTLTFRLPYCGSNLIPHFFCDIPPLLKLVSADTSVNGTVMFVNSGVVSVFCVLLIMVSYLHILHAILQISSAQGRRKTFSTCGAHLTSVTLYYGPAIFVYIRPTSVLSVDTAIQVFCSGVTPMLNPVIYSLRNKEVRQALKKLTCGQATA